MTLSPAGHTIALLLAALVAGALAALLLRACGLRAGSDALLGGALVGALLGATTLARVAPEAHDRYLLGARAAALAYEDEAAAVRAERAALRASDVSEVAVIEYERTASERLDPLAADLLTAREAGRRRATLASVLLAVAASLASLRPLRGTMIALACAAGASALVVSAADLLGAASRAPMWIAIAGAALVGGALERPTPLRERIGVRLAALLALASALCAASVSPLLGAGLAVGSGLGMTFGPLAQRLVTPARPDEG